MKYYLFFMLLFATTCDLKAKGIKCSSPHCVLQDSLSRALLEEVSGFRLGVTPSALINRFPGIQINASFAYRHFGIDQELAYLIPGSVDGVVHKGYRLRTVLKYYLPLHPYKDLTYVGIAHHRRVINYTEETVVSRSDGEYFQRMNVEKKYILEGIPLMFGAIVKQSDHLLIDIAVGAGRIRDRPLEYPNLPRDAEVVSSHAYPGIFEESMILYILHFKLQYRF